MYSIVGNCWSKRGAGLGADSGYVEASARIAAWERALLHALRPYSGQGWAWNVVTPFTVHL